jgi:hypothetical protein
MNPTGGSDDDLLVRARSVLLDALIALDAHHDSVVVIGAQAIYLHTGSTPVAVAEATKDSDLGIDLRTLGDDPLIEEAMTRAGFHHDPLAGQPGSWLSPDGIPVDLMVPDAIAGQGRRSVEAPPHDKRAMRRAVGLEAAVVDNAVMTIRALAADDDRSVEARVAGPAALLVAKLHKIGDRQETPDRLLDKDAYDVYRLLVAVKTDVLAAALIRLLSDELAGDVTSVALDYLAKLFGTDESVGSVMAGRAEELVGDPAVVAAACAALAGDLLAAVGR